MALITSRADLSQGSSLAVSSATFATGTGADIRIHTGASNLLPALAVNEFFEVRDHSSTQNNGLYRVVTVTTSTDDYECDKVNGSAPVTAAAEAITTLGATGVSTEKSVFYDTAGLGIYLLEQGNLSADGVTGAAIYSFTMQEWKDDNFIIKNAPFPMNAIDNDAGKYFIGQDSSGNNNGFNWVDDAGFSIRTRKLLRNMGWAEIDANGIIKAQWFCALTLGNFEDPSNDTAFYQFGTDTTVDDTVDFDFAGPVNEAVKFYEEIGNPDTFTYVDGGGGNDTCTRATGSFVTDGFKVGGQMTTRASTTAANDGTYLITGVSALTLTFATGTFNTGQADPLAQVSVDNSNAVRLGLRVRDGDPNGKTYEESNLTKSPFSTLGNFVIPFGLANATDLKITETDANIDANVPYTGMSMTFHSTPQARGGLVGGPYNFGIIVDANNGTNVQVHEWVQRQLRKLTDIDADADTAIGRTIGLLGRFNGDTYEIGSGDGGLTFPINPDGGGSGVFIDNLNAASDNATQFFDNTGVLRSKPESIAVTLDFNAIAIDDTATEYDLFYDRTIRTNVTDFVLTSGATPTITSAGTQLPNNAESGVGSYMRVSGLTGGDAAMNGVYQIVTETTPGAAWDVVRYDGATIVSVAASTVDIDQNCVDTPDGIIVDTNVSVAGTTISFTAPDQMLDSGSGLGVYAVGDRIRVEGTTGGTNDGIYEVAIVTAGQIDFVEQTITTQAAGPTVTTTKIFSGLADADVVENYAFDDNVQGGRVVSTTTFVKAKAIGEFGSQYIESPVSTIASGTPVTIPLFAPQERNVLP